MAGKRKRHGVEFEARAAPGALRGELTAAQLAARHGVRQTMVGGWKRQAVEGLALMRLIGAQFLDAPWHGSRQMARHLRREGHVVGRKRVRRLMALMGGVAQGPGGAAGGKATERTRKALSWRMSNTMDAVSCLEALEEALGRFGRPGIFNTGQGSQFTSPRFTGALLAAGVRVSMDGRGRWMGTVFIGRLWRSLKCERVCLHAFEAGPELRAGLARWIGCYDARRPHSTLAGRTPDKAYGAGGKQGATGTKTEKLAA